VIDVMFLAWNRRAFTEAAWATLIANTDWNAVENLYVYDDGSTDGTQEWLREQAEVALVPTSFVILGHRSPVAAMKDFAMRSDCEWFAKIDSDVCVPPGWLGHMLGVLDRNPDVQLLGMEAGMTVVAGRSAGHLDPPWDGEYGFAPSTHIGAVGLMHRPTIATRSLHARGRNGFTEFQHIHQPVRGWITPDLPVVLLDRLPHEP